jgi:prepilin-type N-terminal cleavage/methylation domain-containing protein
VKKRGFTILEVLVAAIILALVVFGLANVFVAAKRLIAHSSSRMAGGEIGRLFVDPLQLYVRQDTWSDVANPLGNPAVNALANGTYYCDTDSGGTAPAGHLQLLGCPSYPQRTIGGITYKAKYDINRMYPIAYLNRVKINITWTEPSP